MAEETYRFNDGSGLTQSGGVVRDAFTEVAQNQNNLTARINTPQAPVPQTSTPVIPVNQITPQAPLAIPALEAKPDTASALVDGMEAGQKTYEKYLAEQTAPETEAQKKASSIQDSLQTLLPQAGGKKNALAAEEEKQGVNTLTKEIAALTGEATIKVAEYKKLIDDVKKNSNFKGSFSAKENEIKNTAAAEIGMINSQIIAKQGNLQAAKDVAARAIDLKYESIEDDINLKFKQLEVLAPTLSRDEARQAAALQNKLEDEKLRVAEQKQKAKENIGIVLESGIKTKLMNKNGEWSRTSDGKTYDDPAELFKDFPELQGDFNKAYDLGLVTDFSLDRIAERDFVAQIAAKYPDAGVKPGMTVDEATRLLQGSRIYREQTRPPQYVTNPSPSSPGGLIGPDGKPLKLTATQADTLTGFDNTVGSADVALQLIAQGAQSGPIAGNTLKLKKLTGGADPIQLKLEQTIGKLRADYQRAISGAAVSEGEVKRLSAFLPSITDQEDVIKSKLGTLKEEVSRAKGNFLNTLGATNTSSGLELTQPDGSVWQQNADGSFTQIK